MRSQLLVTTAIALAGGGLAPAPAGAALPRLGVADGVRLTAASSRITITLRPGGRVYRQVRGGRLALTCYRVSAFPTGPAVGESTSTRITVPRGRHRVSAGLPTSPRPSFCTIENARGRELAAVALTHAGAVWLDERRTAVAIQAVVTGAAVLSDDRGGTAWPSSADIVGAAKGGVTALEAPDAPAPAGGIGVYSDGARHLRVSARSSLGRELYIEYRDDALISNAVLYLEFD